MFKIICALNFHVCHSTVPQYSAYVAVPCRNRRLFHCIFRSRYHIRSTHSCIRYSRIYKAHMSPTLNPLTTNDDYSCHRTSPACYQLVQSVFFCEEVLALWASYLLQCPYPVVYTVAMSRTDAAQEFWGWTIDAVFVYTRSVNHIHNAIFISMEMLT